MESYTVTGDCGIQGTDGVVVAPGGVVVLDPEVTNIPALIAGGHVTPAAKTTPKRTPAPIVDTPTTDGA